MRVVVTAHPARRQNRGLLVGMDCVYVEDDGCGLVSNTLRSIELAESVCDGDWGLRAEDDVRCDPGLCDVLPDVLATAPSDAVLLSFCSIYPGTGPWAALPPTQTFFTYLMATRKGWYPQLSEGVRVASRYYPGSRKREWDRFLTDWIQNCDIPAYVYFPSLVQHVGVVSLIGHRFSESPTFKPGGTSGFEGNHSR